MHGEHIVVKTTAKYFVMLDHTGIMTKITVCAVIFSDVYHVQALLKIATHIVILDITSARLQNFAVILHYNIFSVWAFFTLVSQDYLELDAGWHDDRPEGQRVRADRRDHDGRN